MTLGLILWNGSDTGRQLIGIRRRRPAKGRISFVLPDCYDYIPYLQLCVCYDRMGDYITASMYNEKAGKCKPDSEAYLANKTYFERRLEL